MKILLIACVLFLACRPGHAFELIHPVTIYDKTMTWRIDLPGVSPDGNTWDDLFRIAIQNWNDMAGLNLQAASESLPDNCIRQRNHLGYEPNTVRFNTTQNCEINAGGFAQVRSNLHLFQWTGSAWGYRYEVSANTPAVPGITDSVIFFLNKEPGPYVGREESFMALAGHELGHALGLGHTEILSSLMSLPGDGYAGITHDDICGMAVLLQDYGRCASYISAATTADTLTHAHFVTYASSNGGIDRRETFRPWNEVDVFGTIVFDPAHFEVAGAVHILAQLDNVFYARRGELWEPWADGPLPAAYEFEELGYADDFVILGRNGAYEEGAIVDVSVWTTLEWDQYYADERPLVTNAITGEKLGIGDGVSLSFWIAYSSIDAPGVYHYGSHPLVVTWSTDID